MSDTDSPGIAVVTPYWRTPPDKLQRCLRSVQEQTLAATHFLVADGEPVDLPQRPGLVHVVLPRNVGNMGSTPRGIGAQLAFNQGFEALAFLDADNWFEPDHLQRAVTVLERHRLDVVFGRRRIVFPDGEEMLVCDREDESSLHADTNCWVISRRAAFLAGVWAMFPRVFGSGEDRLAMLVARSLKLKSARMAKPTVWYESNWGAHYRLAGKEPTLPTRRPVRDVGHHFDPELYRRHTGLSLPVERGKDAPVPASIPPAKWRIAVVTPYLGEAPGVLERCMSSVRAQGSDTTHVVVGERLPQLGPDGNGKLIAWSLPGVPEDRGNTLRGLGAILAFQLGFDAVAFLDAQGWWAADHLNRQLDVFRLQPADMVLGRVGLPPATEAVSAAGTAALPEAVNDVANAALIASSAAFVAVQWAQLPASPSPRHDQALLMRNAQAGRVRVVSAPAVTAFRDAAQPEHTVMVGSCVSQSPNSRT